MTPLVDVLNIGMIRKFITVAELKNITKAADVLFISQPVLSRQLIRFEETLGIKLFYRGKRGVKLTSDGLIIYSQCKKILSLANEFSDTVARLQNTVSGALKIAHQRSSAVYVADIHRGFLNRYPYVSITTFRQGERNYVDLLTEETLHFAYIDGFELDQCPKEIQSILITNKKNMLLVSTNNPLSARERVHISELKDERFVLPDGLIYPNKQQIILDNCRKADFCPDIVGYSKNFDDIIQYVATYEAVSIVPYMQHVEGVNPVKYVELDGIPQNDPTKLAWNSKNTHPLISGYIDFVREYLSLNRHNLVPEISYPAE